MPRRKTVSFKREISPDVRFNSVVVQKLINVIMWRGKKSVARSIVYIALDELVKRAGGDKDKGLGVFLKALENITPSVEVRPRRVGGSVYQIPREVQSARGQALAMRWLTKAASTRSDKTMGMRLARELQDAYAHKGTAIKRKVDTHRMAEANRAFSHYAW